MMEKELSKEEFNELMRRRTKEIAVRVVKMYAKVPKTDEFVITSEKLNQYGC